MKWKRSRKAKEQASASSQVEKERLRSEGKVTSHKTEETRRGLNVDGRRLAYGLEDEEEDDEVDEEEEDDEVEEEEVSQHGYHITVNNKVGMSRSTDFLQHSSKLGYDPHSPFSDGELEGVQVGGGDRKIGAGL